MSNMSIPAKAMIARSKPGKWRTLTAFIAVLGGTTCTDVADRPALAADIDGTESTSASTVARDQHARALLVTFHSGTNWTHTAGPKMTSYRVRGHYRESAWSRRQARRLAREHRLQTRADWLISEIDQYCVVYEIGHQRQLEDVIAAVASDPDVVVVQPMGIFHTQAAPEIPRAGSFDDPYYGLQAVSKWLDLPSLHQRAQGHGIDIAIIDTGIDATHTDLIGQVITSKDFTAGNSTTLNAEKHGTAVAGIIAAHADNGTGIAGIAPAANLLSLKACWAQDPDRLQATCTTYTLARALNEALRRGAKIFNLSLTGPYDELLAQLLNEAIARNIVIVAPLPPTASKAEQVFPATYPGVLAVSSWPRSRIATLGDATALEAPGRDIITTTPNNRYEFLTGTSFAAAHMSGLAALILEQFPDMSLAQMAKLMRMPDPLSLSARPSDPQHQLAHLFARE